MKNKDLKINYILYVKNVIINLWYEDLTDMHQKRKKIKSLFTFKTYFLLKNVKKINV